MLKLATIGTSWITSSFIEAALAAGQWALSYVYSRDIGKAEALLRKYATPGEAATPYGAAGCVTGGGAAGCVTGGGAAGCEATGGVSGGAAFDDLEELARRRPDAVYIASPNSLHYEQSMFFLQRGIHVICEKPAAVGIREWEAMERAAGENGVFILEALRHINSPGFVALQRAASSIGPVRNAIFSYNQYSSKYGAYLRGETPNVFNPAFAGGAMNDIGVYPISLAAALWGVPQSVRSTFYMLRRGGGVRGGIPQLAEPTAPFGKGAESSVGGGCCDGAGALALDYGSFVCGISFSKIVDGLAQSEIMGEAGNVLIDKPQELSRIYLCPRADDPALKTKLSDYGKDTAERIDVSVPLADNKMEHEAALFADIIIDNDRARYERLLGVSRATHTIMEAARCADKIKQKI